MTINRDIDADRAATFEVLKGERPIDDGQRNWLGHRLNNKASRIDAMLLTGASKSQMLKKIAPARNEVNAHFSHLRLKHGLALTDAGGVWSFDVAEIRRLLT